VDRAGRSIEETVSIVRIFSLELTSRAPTKIEYGFRFEESTTVALFPSRRSFFHSHAGTPSAR
jgi:hypothetical protein